MSVWLFVISLANKPNASGLNRHEMGVKCGIVALTLSVLFGITLSSCGVMKGFVSSGSVNTSC